MEAAQSRVNFTTEVLGRIRDAKQLGLAGHFHQTITRLARRGARPLLSRTAACRRSSPVSASRQCPPFPFRPLATGPRLLRDHMLASCLQTRSESLSSLWSYAIAARLSSTGQLSVTETVTTLSLIRLLSQASGLASLYRPQCLLGAELSSAESRNFCSSRFEGRAQTADFASRPTEPCAQEQERACGTQQTQQRR